MTKNYLLLLFAVCFSVCAFAQWNKLSTVQPNVWFDDGNTIWAGAYGTVYKSTDKGLTWESKKEGLNSGLASSRGFAKVGNTLFVTFGGNGNFYAYYTNDGETWTIDTANWPIVNMGWGMTIRPFATKTLSHKNEYVVCGLESNYILYKKPTDAAWTHMSLPTTHRTPDWIYSSGDTLFLGSNNNAIFNETSVAYTTDMGANWETRTLSTHISAVYKTDVSGKLIGAGALSISTLNNKILYVSHDNGITWDSLNVRSKRTAASFIVAVTGSNIYAAVNDNKGAEDTLNRLLHSPDGGQTWNDITGNIYSHLQFKFHPFDGILLKDGNVLVSISSMGFTSAQNGGGGVGLNHFNTSLPLQVYPNPVRDVLQFSNALSAKIMVYDFAGRLVLVNENNNGAIDVSSLQNGLYVIELRDGEQVYQSKFIKE